MQFVLSLSNSRFQVVDVETGENLGHGQDGEICVKGPTVMKGKNGQVMKNMSVTETVHLMHLMPVKSSFGIQFIHFFAMQKISLFKGARLRYFRQFQH